MSTALIVIMSCCVLLSLIGGGGAYWWFNMRNPNYYVDKNDVKHSIELSKTSKQLKNVKKIFIVPSSVPEDKKLKISHTTVDYVTMEDTDYDKDFTTPINVDIQLMDGNACDEGKKWNITKSICEQKSIKCQFIKITKNADYTASKDGFLSIREVEVYDENGDNVALNKPTTSSSNWGSGTPGMVVDGNKTGVYHTDNTTKPGWWQVDLGSELNITKIKVWRQLNENNGDWGNRFNGATIDCIAADGTVVHSVIAETLDTTKENPYEQEFNFDETTITEPFKNVNKKYSFL